jgi:4'-phosphopantetheinyl transferase
MILTRADVLAGWFERSPDLIRIWRVPLDASFGEDAWLKGILSPDEADRANHYFFDRDRRRFTIGRAVLRLILSGYLETEAEQVQFSYGKFGKPTLAAPNAGIRFNVSHSQDVAVVAVAHGREVGVDIEFVRQLTDREQLLTATFSSRELAVYRLLPCQQQQAAFFAGWTRKEAYLKARGEGLSIPLDSFAVSLGPDPAALVEVRHDPMEPARWSMANLSVAPGYAGALVAEGGGWRFDYADWDGAIGPVRTTIAEPIHLYS